MFVKFGQAMSTRRDLLPTDIAQELVKLQDQVPPFPAESRAAVIESAGRAGATAVPPLRYRTAGRRVHRAGAYGRAAPPRRRARAKSSSRCLRPGMRALIQRDIAVLYALARLARVIPPKPAPAPGGNRARVRDHHPR